MNKFKIYSKFKPMGDQPKAIDSLAHGIEEGQEFQTLLGGYWFREDVYHGKYYRKGSKANYSTST